MQEQVRNFLERSGGHASSLAIASHVLRLRNATPAMAERVVSALLQDKNRFVADGLGNWYLARTNSENTKQQAERSCLIFTPMSAQELKTARRVVFGWRYLAEHATPRIFEVMLDDVTQPAREECRLPQCSRQEFAQHYLPELQMSVLWAWNISTALAALRRITLNMPEAWLPAGRIPLQKLTRKLLSLNRPPQLAFVYEKLLHTKPRSESWEDQIEAQAEVWRALQTHCATRGLLTWEQIAHFAQAPPRADFSQFDFDEKMIANLPEQPGVYVMKDRDGRVIYVGKAANLRTRVRGYFANAFTEEAKLRQMLKQVAQLHYELFDTELEALLREQVLIKRFRPALNRQVEVHEAAAARSEQIIFLVPLQAKPEGAKNGRVVVYFLSAHKLQRVPINLARIPRVRLREVMAEFIATEAQKVGMLPKQRTQVEIAQRWVQQNRGRISSLTIEEHASIEQLEARLLRLLRAPEIFHERVELA